jgi:aryl-alcohol dehydrogenase-like predicted oxidoreductase
VAVSNEADALWLMDQDLVDVLQITYSIFHTEPENGLFAMAEAKGVGLLCRMPLARGVLTGKFHPGSEVGPGHRALLDGDQVQENIRRAEMLRPMAASVEGGMTRMALKFSLSAKAISAIIPGARTWDQLEENVAASDGSGLSTNVLADIESTQAGWA